MATLSEKRAAIKERHKFLTEDKNSAWNPEHGMHPDREMHKTIGTNSLQPDLECKPVKSMPLAARPVAFVDNDEFHFLGEDCQVIATAAKSYADKATEAIKEALAADPPEEVNWQVKAALEACKAGKTGTLDGQPSLTFIRRHFNNLMHAMTVEGVKVCSTQAKDPSKHSALL